MQCNLRFLLINWGLVKLRRKVVHTGAITVALAVGKSDMLAWLVDLHCNHGIGGNLIGSNKQCLNTCSGTPCFNLGAPASSDKARWL